MRSTRVRSSPWRAVFVWVLVVLAFVWLAPKIRLLPPAITNATWSGRIVYSDAGGSERIECGFYQMDSTPYWEGNDASEDEVCSKIPAYMHQGLPPLSIQRRIGDRVVELHAPLIWGRLL